MQHDFVSIGVDAAPYLLGPLSNLSFTFELLDNVLEGLYDIHPDAETRFVEVQQYLDRREEVLSYDEDYQLEYEHGYEYDDDSY